MWLSARRFVEDLGSLWVLRANSELEENGSRTWLDREDHFGRDDHRWDGDAVKSLSASCSAIGDTWRETSLRLIALWWPNLDDRCQGQCQKSMQFFVLVANVRTASGHWSYPFAGKEIAQYDRRSDVLLWLWICLLNFERHICFSCEQIRERPQTGS